MAIMSDSDYVNVKQAPYNAKGDGYTNDTAAIMNAWAVNHKIYFPSGTYICNLNFPDNTWIKGALSGHFTQSYVPTTTTLKAAPGNNSPVVKMSPTVPSSKGWGVKNIILQHNGSGTGICLDLSPNGGTLHNGVMDSVWLFQGSVGLNIDGNVRYSIFKDATIGEHSIAILKTGGGSAYNYYDTFYSWASPNIIYTGDNSSYFNHIAGEGYFLCYGDNNTFLECINENGSFSIPQPTLVVDYGKNNIWDIYSINPFKRIPAAQYSFYLGTSGQYSGDGAVIKRYHEIDIEGNPLPPYPLYIEDGKHATIFSFDCNSSSRSRAEQYLTPQQLRNVKIEGGGAFFQNFCKGEGYGTSIPGGSSTVGNIVWHTDPGSGDPIGWVYTSSGWKGFGNVV